MINEKRNMKNLFKILAILMLTIGFVSCNDDETYVESALEVNFVNLNGTWMLAEWNGKPLEEGTYCYITFNRREQTFEMYQKFDSMYARYITGSLTIKKDDYLGYVVSGRYDYQNGKWNNDYVVSDLLPSGSMIWTVKGNADDVSKYVRVDEVPSSVKDEARHPEAE